MSALFPQGLSAQPSSFSAPSALSRRRLLGAVALSGGLGLLGPANAALSSIAPVAAESTGVGPSLGGLYFSGSASQVRSVEKGVRELFHSFHLPSNLLVAEHCGCETSVWFRLAPGVTEQGTLNLQHLPRLWLQDEVVDLPGRQGRVEQRIVVSKKEILLALLTPGRTSAFTGAACNTQALVDHIGLRQNIAAWARRTDIDWPEGGPAVWNKAFWHQGTPRRDVDLHQAFLDVLVYPERYAVGCYTAAKLILSGSILDYFVRVAPDARKASYVKALMWSNGDPLVDIEPQSVWSFEPNFDEKDLAIEGKLLRALETPSGQHFVPGDWIYLWNTDPISYEKTGYEGSNAIYLGNGRFSDYYNDNSHSFTFEQKLDEVFQWRNGVYSRSRDFDKASVLSAEQITALSRSPQQGGFLLPWRLAPRHFGFGG